MNVAEGKGKVFIGILSAILMALGGYSVDTITTLVESNQELSIKISKLESEIEFVWIELSNGKRLTWQEGVNLVGRIERLELRVDGMVPDQNE